MSENTNQETPEMVTVAAPAHETNGTPAIAAKPKAPRKAKPVVAKVRVGKPTKAKPAKAPKGKTDPDKILVPQIRILRALIKSKTGLNKEGIISKASISKTYVAEYIGTLREMISETVRGARKLAPAGFVKITLIPVNAEGGDEIWYSITTAGRKVIERLDK